LAIGVFCLEIKKLTAHGSSLIAHCSKAHRSIMLVTGYGYAFVQCGLGVHG
jgi:hypothetical protein